MIKFFFYGVSLGALSAMLVFSACADTPKGDSAKVATQEKPATATGQAYLIDTSGSRIHFVGNGVGKNHPGTFQLTSGSLSVADNRVTGGEFVINVQSLDLEQRDEMIQQKLRPHLLSPDFFDAGKFGTAKFVITSVTPYQPAAGESSVISGANFTVSGNLTLKDATKNLSFPAKIDLTDNNLHAQSNFNLDRTQWGMTYRADKGLGDKFISETVNIQLDLQATKQ